MKRLAACGGALTLVGVTVMTGCDKQSVPERPNLSGGFEVPPLEVHTVTPREGLAGDVITVTGVGFDPAPAQNRAYIGGAGVTVLTASETTLTLRVPEWASNGPIRVTDAYGFRSATSEDTYEVKTPGDLTTGYNGEAGQPQITSSQPDTQTIDASSTTVLLSGTVTGDDGDGYWAIIETDGTVRSMGRLPLEGTSYAQTVPVFCGAQSIVRFFANDSGRAFYRTELTRTGCSEAGIRVQLAWDTDETDVDLHLIRPGGSFNNNVSDCHWANSNPDWGVEEDASDDPELDVDDVDGFGPENIYVTPSVDGTYRVTVYYFSDHGVGPSNAWLEVYIDGLRAGTMGPYLLQSTGTTWQVADIAWPSGEVTAVP